MKKLALAGALALWALSGSGCATDPATGRPVWITNLSNFFSDVNLAVVTVNQGIADTSPQLATLCNSLYGVGVAVSKITTGGTANDMAGINAGLSKWCTGVADDQSVGDAIDSVQQAIAAGKAAYKSATGRSL